MRAYYIAILILVLSGTNFFADTNLPSQKFSQPDPGGWGVGISGNVMGRHYSATIGPSDVANTPKWSFETENPPVSVREAVRLARKSLADTVGDLKDWTTERVSLAKLPEGYWVYEIEFDGPSYRAHQDELVSFRSAMGVYVLMNGRAICPQPKINSKSHPG